MNCPKCGHPRQGDEAMCSGCGIYFAKWEARQRQLEELAATLEAQKASPDDAGTVDGDWSRTWARRAAFLLMAGFLMPLYKSSMVAGQSYIVWPWQLAGFTDHPGIAMALGTASEGTNPVLWVLLPLATALLVLILGRAGKSGTAMATNVALGLGSLALLLIVFFKESQRFGLAFTPPSAGAGIIVTIAIAAGALIAAANHASRMAPDVLKPARWAGAGGVILLCLTSLFMFAGSGVWTAWPMRVLFGLMLVYALMAATRLFGIAPGVDSITWLGRLARLLVGLSLIAVIMAQSADPDPYSMYVIQGGGSTAGTIMAAAKSFMIYFGSALVLAVGIGAWLEKQSAPVCGDE